MEDCIEIGTNSVDRAGRSVFVNTDDHSKVIRRCIPKRGVKIHTQGSFFLALLSLAIKRFHHALVLLMACLQIVESSCWQSSHWRFLVNSLLHGIAVYNGYSVSYTIVMVCPPCFVSSKFDFTSLIPVQEKWGLTYCLATPTARRARNLNYIVACMCGRFPAIRSACCSGFHVAAGTNLLSGYDFRIRIRSSIHVFLLQHTPVYKSARYGHNEVVIFLIEHGAQQVSSSFPVNMY